MLHLIDRSADAGRLKVRFTCKLSCAAPVHDEVIVEPFPGMPDTFVVSFDLSAGGEVMTIEKSTIAVEFSAADMHGLYHPFGNVQDLVRLPFFRRTFTTSATQAAPLWAFLHQSGRNRVAIGLGDQLTPTTTDQTLSEHTRTITLRATKPIDPVLRRTQHVERVFVCLADVPLKTLLAAYGAFVDRAQPQTIMPVPDCAYDPVFCTWTAIHTDVSAEWTERNARLAVDLGFRTLLTDDGWMDWPDDAPDEKLAGGQTYAFLGDWKPHPRKFPDMAGHVKRVQAMGMRYLLWVAPFFMGERYADYGRFRDKGWYRPPWGTRTGGNVYLDPRYPAVIEYVRRLLLRLVRDYGLDGLKIDFVDGVASKIEPHMAPLPLGAEGGPALQELLGSVMDLLRRDKPDLMIECRQGYSNFAARRWANCYRSPDVPINFHQNRFNCAMLRLLLPDRAVFFDPALWPMDDPDENVGRHMISAISAVPMISIEFDRYPKSHLEIVRHWIGFYHQHRPTLVRGGFEPLIELGHNPQTVFRGRDETIVGLYADRPLVLEHPGHRLYILNGSTRPWIDVVPAGAAATRTVQVFTATGQDVGRAEIQFPCWRVDVPVGGYAAVT